MLTPRGLTMRSARLARIFGLEVGDLQIDDGADLLELRDEMGAAGLDEVRLVCCPAPHRSCRLAFWHRIGRPLRIACARTPSAVQRGAGRRRAAPRRPRRATESGC